jgi:hypothetical protein
MDTGREDKEGSNMADKYAKIGEYTPVEAMVINAARFVKNFDGQRGLIGTGLPLVATQLAKMLYSPNMIIFVETGQADAKPEELPISIMDSRLTYGSSWQMGDPEGLFPLSRGEIDFGFIGGAPSILFSIKILTASRIGISSVNQISSPLINSLIFKLSPPTKPHTVLIISQQNSAGC